MNLTKFVPNGVTSNIGRHILKTQKVSPTLLFAGGVVGVVATAVLASRATLRLDEVLDKMDHNLETANGLHDGEVPTYSDADYQRDKVIIYTQTTVAIAKLYAPAVIVGGLSIAALTGSHIMLTRRNAALTAAYAAIDKSFREYRKRVVEEFGEETDDRLRQTSAASERGKEVALASDKKDPNSYSGYARFFDELNPNYQREPEFNFLFLRCQQNYANDLLRSRGHLFLNEVYQMLKIDHSRAGAVVGWVMGNGDNYVDFGIFDGTKPKARDFVNGYEPAILLDFNVDGVIYDKI